MAEERDIIIDVNVEGNADEAIGQISNEIRENRQQIKELSKDYENNATEIAGLERSNRELSKSKKELIKDSNVEQGSLNDLRRQLSKLTAERNDTNLTTKEGATRAKELNAEILSLTDSIKEQEEAGGDFRRSVGEYPTLFSQAAGGIKVFGTSLSDVFKLIVANPIGLLVTALVGLVSVFKETQTGAELFRKASAVLNTTLGLLSDVVESLGNTLIDAFTDPQQAFEDFSSSIKENVLDYFTEFIPNAVNKVIDGFGALGEAVKQLFQGDFTGALESAQDGVIGLADGLTDLNPATAILKTSFEAAAEGVLAFSDSVAEATQNAFLLEQQLIANEKAIADQEVIVAKSLATQKELNLTIEDQTALIDDRIAAAIRFNEVEEAQINESIRLAQERLDILKAQNELTNSTEEDIQRVRDAEKELAILRAASFERQVTNQTKLNALLKQNRDEQVSQIQEINDLEQQSGIQSVNISNSVSESLIKNTQRVGEVTEKQAQDQIALEQQVANAKQAIANASFGLASDLVGLAVKDTKTAASIQAGLSTAQGVAAALGSAPPPYNFILAGLTGAAGAVQIAKINSTSTDIKSGSLSSAPARPSGGVPSSAGLANVNASLLGQFSETAQQTEATTSGTASAVSNIPAPQVAVTDINTAQDNRNVKVTETSL